MIFIDITAATFVKIAFNISILREVHGNLHTYIEEISIKNRYIYIYNTLFSKNSKIPELIKRFEEIPKDKQIIIIIISVIEKIWLYRNRYQHIELKFLWYTYKRRSLKITNRLINSLLPRKKYSFQKKIISLNSLRKSFSHPSPKPNPDNKSPYAWLISKLDHRQF